MVLTIFYSSILSWGVEGSDPGFFSIWGAVAPLARMTEEKVGGQGVAAAATLTVADAGRVGGSRRSSSPPDMPGYISRARRIYHFLDSAHTPPQIIQQ